jgi:hypothetical protein
MNMDDFEKTLASQPLRGLPSHWRDGILARASTCVAQPPARPAAAPLAGPFAAAWWRSLLWPNPAAWGGLAGAWLLTLGLAWLSSISKPTADAAKGVAASGWSLKMVLAMQHQVELELATLEAPPATPPPAPPSASRRQSWRIVTPPVQCV